ncbi:Zinc finger protein ZPR1 [Porphyridium purpureum]|uniref:Zinc finger protein ZPR1 n=1 Tax=Porphyridium purpureum TaxID=35688 RepID=A0A5J4YRN0_PORPP|nr:Zinc finger protein ZPR1 [Porphyridium purpureum]|eukprot:POR0163..scf229_5
MGALPHDQTEEMAGETVVEAEGGQEARSGHGVLKNLNVDVSHQEVERIIDELESLHELSPEEWLLVEPVCLTMALDLGYEDLDEFEDALKGSIVGFLRSLPQFELRVQDEDGTFSEERGPLQEGQRLVFRVTPLPRRSPVSMSVSMARRDDLFRIFLKAPDAVVEIPEMDFEMGLDRKRRIDTIYNFVSTARLNLEMYLNSNRHMQPTLLGTIRQTVEALEKLLDMDTPWTFVVHDPSGLSEFKPFDGVMIGELEESRKESVPVSDH